MKKQVASGMGAAVAQEMLWLAWKACGGPVGMGYLQDNPSATKEQVWNGMMGASDYTGNMKCPMAGEVAADYVFGRMMKLYFKFTDNAIEWGDGYDKADPDYNSWARKYRSITELFDAAVLMLIDNGVQVV